MNYHSPKRSSSSSWFARWLLIAAGLGVVLTLVFATGIFGWLDTGIQRGARPVWLARDYSLNNIRDAATLATSSKQSLIREIEELRFALEQEAPNQSRIMLLEQENEHLNTILNRRPADALNRTLALIIATPRASSYDTIVIDRGEDAGISVGNQVVAYGDMALGHVIAVYKKSARVQLYSASGSVMSGRLAGNELFLSLKGRGGGNFIFEVPRDIEITQGDVIVPAFDATQIIGIVEGVKFDPRDPFQSVFVATPFNVNHVEYVEVVME